LEEIVPFVACEMTRKIHQPKKVDSVPAFVATMLHVHAPDKKTLGDTLRGLGLCVDLKVLERRAVKEILERTFKTDWNPWGLWILAFDNIGFKGGTGGYAATLLRV
jgi:hypothetical protein